MLRDPDVSRAELAADAIGVGPWLDTLLPHGLARADIVVAYGLPGVGASTLALTVAAHAAEYGPVAWITTAAERSLSELREMQERLDARHENISFIQLDHAADVVELMRQTLPAVCVVDRIQDLGGWKSSAVRAAYRALAHEARLRGTVLWLNSGSNASDEPFGLGRYVGDAAVVLRLHRPVVLAGARCADISATPLTVTVTGSGHRVVRHGLSVQLDLGESGLSRRNVQRATP